MAGRRESEFVPLRPKRRAPAAQRSITDEDSMTLVDRTRAKAATPAALAAAFKDAVQRELAQRSDRNSPEAWLWAAAQASRAVLAERWARTQAEDRADKKARHVHYLSMEFLMGRALGNAVAALGLDDELRAATQAAGQSLPDVIEREADAALGNGGLGRLAACFLDSFATLGLPWLLRGRIHAEPALSPTPHPDVQLIVHKNGTLEPHDEAAVPTDQTSALT